MWGYIVEWLREKIKIPQNPGRNVLENSIFYSAMEAAAIAQKYIMSLNFVLFC